jgi:glycosyltransferase involved in cell wall biosynthesis
MLFVTPQLAGGRVYCDGLLRGLSAVDTVNTYTVYVRRGIALPNLPPERFVQVVAPVADTSSIWRTIYEYQLLPRQIHKGAVDLFHGLGSLSPRIRTCPVVLTIHDLIYRHFPASIPLGYRLFMRQILPRAARRADRVIVPSQCTMKDMMQEFGVHEEKIRLVPYGPGNDLVRITDSVRIEAALRRYNVRRPYVISVSRAYPHKNIDGLLRAFASLHSHGQANAQLVLVGDREHSGRLLNRVTQELGLASRVVFTGQIGNEDLAALYSGAAVFAFPSLAEGFGLPILEAMACGAPVVASNASAVPEAVGGAGLLANPRDPREFADAIGRVLHNQSLQDELRGKGFTRIKEFSWQRTAQLTLDVYRELE